MKSHARSTTKRTGGRRRSNHKKRKHELGSSPTETRVDDRKLKLVETRGGNTKVRAIQNDVASVATGDGTTVQATIENVAENASNPNYVRRNIVTKGAVIETSEGRARVTSRPGQDGQINAVLVDDE
jgi:small subunit ribosomal protein S8e